MDDDEKTREINSEEVDAGWVDSEGGPFSAASDLMRGVFVTTSENDKEWQVRIEEALHSSA